MAVWGYQRDGSELSMEGGVSNHTWPADGVSVLNEKPSKEHQHLIEVPGTDTEKSDERELEKATCCTSLSSLTFPTAETRRKEARRIERRGGRPDRVTERGGKGRQYPPAKSVAVVPSFIACTVEASRGSVCATWACSMWLEWCLRWSVCAVDGCQSGRHGMTGGVWLRRMAACRHGGWMFFLLCFLLSWEETTYRYCEFIPGCWLVEWPIGLHQEVCTK